MADEEPKVTEGEGQAAPEIPDLDPDVVAAILDRYASDPIKRDLLTPKLRTNRYIAGMAGEVAQRQREAGQQEAARLAIENERKRMRELADTDPDALATELKTKLDLDDKRREIAGLRDTTRREFAERIGNALKDLPEFQELTAEDVNTLGTKMRGVPEDEVVGLYTRLAVDLVSEKRSRKLTETEVQKRLAEAKKDWETEQRTKRLQERRSPSLTPPSNGNASDSGEPADFTSPEWDRWYQTQRKSGRLVRAG